ncbi:MAG: UvrB/UvrC motif-containing protein [Candidatus Nomurabacteria bacterium]|nr:UvrB/UvrC motif-containing protein [Candidatus Nomurabacteria bacterium]
MPVKGKIYAMPNEFRVENMPVGGEGYFYKDEIIITKSAIFLDQIAPIVSAVELSYYKDIINFIPIKRLGPGLTENDFEIDFSDSIGCEIIVESHGVYLDLIPESEAYIVFYDFDLDSNSKKIISLPLKRRLTLLELKLKLAVESDQFEKAAILRDEISKLKKNK